MCLGALQIKTEAIQRMTAQENRSGDPFKTIQLFLVMVANVCLSYYMQFSVLYHIHTNM